MGLRIKISNIVGVAMILLASQMWTAAAADGEDCINSLVPCSNYLNATTKPPAECCGPLLNVISTQQQCLCNLLNSTIFKQSGLNLTQALRLPALCGDKNVTTDACNKSTAKTPPTSTTRAGSESTNKSGAEAVSFELLWPLLAFLFLGVSV